jgi:hypothetical protein
VLAAGDANEAHPIVLHRLELAEGRVAFVDRAATPAARFDVAGLAGSITPAMAPEGGERRNDVVEVSLRGGLPDGGTGSLEVVLDRSVAMSQVAVAEPGPAGAGTAQSSPPKLPAAPSPRGDSIAPSSSADDGVPVPRSVALTLHDVPAVALSPYAERALGRGLSAGRVNLVFDCASAAGQLTGMLQVSGDELVLANASESTPDSPSNEPQLSTPSPNESPVGAASPNESPPSAPPVRLALALLADPAGRVELASVLAPPQTLESAACLPEVAAGTLRSKLAAIAQAPFETLATVIGRDASSLAAVQFEPGAAEPSEAGLVTLDALAEALERRPKLGLTVAGAYDPKVDRAALAVKEVELHVALETAGATLRVTPGPVDFTLPLAQKVLDEFAARLLTPEQRATIASEFDLHAGGAADAATRVAYYRAVFEALARSQPIQPTALARLGRFRTESIARQLEKRGIGRDRVASADAEGEAIAQNGDVAVPLEAAALPLESAARPLRGGGLLSVQ